MKKYKSIISAFLSVSIVITSCSKNNTDPVGPPTSITGQNTTVTLMPAKSLPNSAVTITGTGFTTDISKIHVTFNGNTATIYSATTTEIVAGVPASAQSGKVVVISDGTTYSSAGDFTVTSGMQSTWASTSMFVAAADASGNIYGANGLLVYKMTASNPSTTPAVFAGSSSGGVFSAVSGIAVDAAGNVYVADANKHSIYKITPSGLLSVLAGGGGSRSADDQGTAAGFTGPYGLTIDASGNLYTTDLTRVRKITPSGLVSTLAGTTQAGNIIDATGTSARFTNLSDAAADAAGNIYVSDAGTFNIRKITPAGVVTTYAGTGTSGSINGASNSAKFLSPGYLAIDSSGNIFVDDNDGSPSASVRMINKAGFVSTFLKIVQTSAGVVNGTLFTSTEYSPRGITFDAVGNMYICNAGLFSNAGVLNKITFN